ncbi:MAG: rod shape-determining protein MreD [Proteobacteria bacterium]|jgi:rod shape-determining protein MreD|nr:rod shape-determining protein MreD [Pseudomonadota bacterium]
MQLSNRSNRLLRPPKPWFVYLSLFIGLVLSYVPFGHRPGIPDWAALVLVFWCIREPQYIGMGIGFFLGILVDIGHGTPMGQHALAYVVLAFIANGLARRIMWFPSLLQALHVLPMLLVAQALMAGVRVFVGEEFPEWNYFLSSIVGAALWLPLTYLLLLPQFQPVDRDENRPI